MGEIVHKPRESCRGTCIHLRDGYLGKTGLAGEPDIERRRNSVPSGIIFLPGTHVLIENMAILAWLAMAAATIAAADAVPHGWNIPPRLTGKPARRATIRR